MQKKKVVVIGSGFSGLSAACFLAKAGYTVTVVEMHDIPGGRARKYEAEGFTFDMGPSWYWMPDVFDRFFGAFDKKVEDFYELVRLDPSYKVFWPDSVMDIAASYDELRDAFENIEPGSAARLDSFLQEAEYKYRVGMQRLVYKSGRSVMELLDAEVISGIFRLNVFTSMRSHLNRFFKDPRLRQLMEFPTLFLGSVAQTTPALYSLMNYADIKLGTWYPKGGMYKIVEGTHTLAVSLGVEFRFGTTVKRLILDGNKVTSVRTSAGDVSADIVLSSADYHHTEKALLPKSHRSYSKRYWASRDLAPSCLIFYVGLDKKLRNFSHHALFFDTPFDQHAEEIYNSHVWPSKPLFYVCAASQTDETVAPQGAENLFILIPVSTRLEDITPDRIEFYFDDVMARMEQRLQQDIRASVIYRRNYCPKDFSVDYNAFMGNAYGLSNTLAQTANLKPSVKSSKVKNLYFAGQLTVPGPGVPPAIISGEVVAKEIGRDFPLS